MKKSHIPGPVPPGNQSKAGPKSTKSDTTEPLETDALDKGGEREDGSRDDVRQQYGHTPAARHDG